MTTGTVNETRDGAEALRKETDRTEKAMADPREGSAEAVGARTGGRDGQDPRLFVKKTVGDPDRI